MSEHDRQHGIRLGRNEAIAQAHRGLTAILKTRRYFVDPSFEVWVKAQDVSDMLGRIS
jgi:hypothetical protein